LESKKQISLMQEISLKNYSTILSPAALRAAEKFVVRECDEISKGKYVAYIDKGENTFDVSLTVVSNKITEHDCDCANSELFCEHKIALLLHITENKKTVQPKLKSRKKTTELDELLESIEPEEIITWTKELLAKHKDLALSFIHHFKTTNHKITPEESIELTLKAWKAVANNKKKVDLTQLKKIITLWEEAQSPVIKQYLANVADNDGFLCLHNVIETCLEFDKTLDINSSRIQKHIEGLLAQTTETIISLQKDEVWETAINHFIDKNFNQSKQYRFHYLKHLLAIVEVSNQERQKLLIEKLLTQFETFNTFNSYQIKYYSFLLIDLTIRYGLFGKYFEYFKPMHYENDFNIKLIQNIILLGKFSLAETYCKEQININFKDKYSLDYWKLLKEIYTTTNNQKGRQNIAKAQLPFTYAFEDYQLAYASFTDEAERKKWRSKILSTAKNEYTMKQAAKILYFKILDSEGKYTAMIDHLDFATDDIMFHYFDKMADTGKTKFLTAFLNHYQRNNTYYSNHNDDDTKSLHQSSIVYDKLITYFSREEIINALKPLEKGYWYRSNIFIQFLKQKLLIIS